MRKNAYAWILHIAYCILHIAYAGQRNRRTHAVNNAVTETTRIAALLPVFVVLLCKETSFVSSNIFHAERMIFDSIFYSVMASYCISSTTDFLSNLEI